MSNNKKSKNNNIEKLRMVLDSNYKKDLQSDNEKYLKILSRRLKKGGARNSAITQLVYKTGSEKEVVTLKPRVTVYPREKKKIDISKPLEEKTETRVEFIPVEKKELKEEKIEISLKEEDIIEIKKVEVVGPKFVEVKPKEPEKSAKIEPEKVEELLVEWEPIETEKIEEKPEIKEEPTTFIEVTEKPEVVEKPKEKTPSFVEVTEKSEVEEKKIEKGKICDNCGSELRKSVKFCTKCGTQVPPSEEISEKKEEVPSFIPVGKTEEVEKPVEKEVTSDWSSLESVTEDQMKIHAFKDLESVDEETAILLYNNGFKSMDDLSVLTVKDLTKIKGIKKKKAKEIIKEIEKKTEWKPIEIEEVPEEKDTEVIVAGETAKGEITEEQVEKIEEEGISREVKIEVFKDYDSIDDDTAILLYDNGFTSVDSLNEASLKDLRKVKGVKRRAAKTILEEIKAKLQESSQVPPIDVGDSAEGKVTEDRLKEEVADVFEKEPEKPAPVELSSKKAEWKTVFEEEPKVEEAEPEEPEIEEEVKIEAFKKLESVNDKTAVLLYDNGFTSLEALKDLTLKDLTKIKGIRKKTARRIMEELEKEDESSDIKTAVEDKSVDEYFIEGDDLEDSTEVDEKKLAYVAPETEEEDFFEEEIKKDVPKIKEGKNEAFKDIPSIDKKTSQLLRQNRIDSVEALNSKTIKELTKIRGIKKKHAKQIKKELKQISDIEKKEIETKEEKYDYDENQYIQEEDEDEWELYDEGMVSDEQMKEIKGFRYSGYTLYEKEIETKSGKSRKVRFFSKAEPEEGRKIKLPKGYKVAKNKKTGVPYLKKK